MKHLVYLFLSVFLFSGCVWNGAGKEELLLDQMDIERIVERVEVMIFQDGSYSEDRVLGLDKVKGVVDNKRFLNMRGLVQNKTFYDVNGCAEYFYRGGAEGFIPYALVHKDGYLDFDESKKNYCVEVVRDENIIIDTHFTIDTIRGFVNYEEQKFLMKIDDYYALRKSEQGKRVVLYYYE